MNFLIRLIGVLSVVVFVLLAFQNFLSFSFSPSGQSGVTVFLMVLFAVCAVGGVGMVFLKPWGVWSVCGGSVLVILSQIIGGRMIVAGNRSPLLLDLLKHVSLQDLSQALGLPFLMIVSGYFHWLVLAVAGVWLFIRKN